MRVQYKKIMFIFLIYTIKIPFYQIHNSPSVDYYIDINIYEVDNISVNIHFIFTQSGCEKIFSIVFFAGGNKMVDADK